MDPLKHQRRYHRLASMDRIDPAASLFLSRAGSPLAVSMRLNRRKQRQQSSDRLRIALRGLPKRSLDGERKKFVPIL